MMTLTKTCRRLAAAAAALLGVLTLPALTVAGSAAHAATRVPAAQCDMRLRVELTPDVPNPRDAGLLSSLLRDHPGYLLTLQRQDWQNASVIVLDLTGPGPEDRCREVVKELGTDRRVWTVDVQQASDHYECDISAVDQTGYDPTEEDGGVPRDAVPAKQTDYFRAEAACLAARGYRVR